MHDARSALFGTAIFNFINGNISWGKCVYFSRIFSQYTTIHYPAALFAYIVCTIATQAGK